MLQVSALEELTDGPVKDRPPVAELAGIAFGVAGVEIVEVFADKAVEVGFRRLTWPVNTDGLIDQARRLSSAPGVRLLASVEFGIY